MRVQSHRAVGLREWTKDPGRRIPDATTVGFSSASFEVSISFKIVSFRRDPDAFIADLAAAAATGQIKTVAPARGKRTVKYNPLTAIAAQSHAPYGLAARA